MVESRHLRRVGCRADVCRGFRLWSSTLRAARCNVCTCDKVLHRHLSVDEDRRCTVRPTHAGRGCQRGGKAEDTTVVGRYTAVIVHGIVAMPPEENILRDGSVEKIWFSSVNIC